MNSKRKEFVTRVVMEMINGPEWCREVRKALDDFCKDDLLGSLKEIVPTLKEKAGSSTN